jgi:NAD(P)H dehydrogenase (quinone)
MNGSGRFSTHTSFHMPLAVVHIVGHLQTFNNVIRLSNGGKRMSTERVLVVGATSTVGGYVVQQLKQAGVLSPVAATRDPEKAASFNKQGIDTVILDLASPDSVAAAMKGIRSVFLLTGYTVEMLQQCKLVVDQSVKAGVKHIVHMGAWAPDDTDIAHFGWHQFIERYIEGSGLEWTHIAPNFFMQNLLGSGSLWRSFSKGKDSDGLPLHTFFGDAKIGWVSAEDIARASVAALHDVDTHAGEKYNLSVEVRSVGEIAEILERTLDQKFTVVDHEPEVFHEALISGGMEPSYAASALDTLRRFRLSAVPEQDKVFDNFKSITGVEPIDWVRFARLHRAEFLDKPQ